MGEQFEHSAALVAAIQDVASAIRGAANTQQTHTILNRIEQMETHIMDAIDTLTEQVAANKTVVDSALVLINGIADRIKSAGVDPAKLAALTSDLKSEDDALAAAVAANTPGAPA